MKVGRASGQLWDSPCPLLIPFPLYLRFLICKMELMAPGGKYEVQIHALMDSL